MKYDATQFEILVQALKILNKHFDIVNINESQLHYIVYQNFSEGQLHNHLMIKGDTIARRHTIEDKTGYTKLIDIKYDFELYPSGCNDNHIETAVKKALKAIK